MRTDDVRVVNPHDTALVSGYRAPRLVGIKEIYPIVEVKKEAGQYTEYGPDASVIRQGLETPLGVPRKMIDVTIAKGDYKAVKVGVKVPIYDEEMDEAADPEQLRESKSLLGEKVIQLGMEYTLSQYLQNASNYDVANVEALTGTDKWDDYTNSDPIGDLVRWLGVMEFVTEADRDELAVGIAPDVLNVLLNHPKLLNRPGAPAGQQNVVTNANLASWIGCKKVEPLRGKYAVTFDRKDPRNTVFARLWSKCVVCYLPIEKPTIETPVPGVIARRLGYPQVEDARDNEIDADIKHVKDKWGLSPRADNRLFLGRTLIT